MLDKPAFPYGAGFRSLTTETPAPIALAVTGALPLWLKGTLLRTGPSKFEVGARTYNHWFDGLAMLHRFAIADGGVSYANRFLESKAFSAAEETGKISYAEFATDPCRTLFGRVAVDLRSEAHRQLLRQRLRLCARNRRLHRDDDAAALRARHAKDARRVRLWRGLDRTNLDGAPALRCEARLPLQLHRRSRHEERLSPVPHRRRRHAVRACRHSGRAAGLHAQLRHERGSSHPHRVPLGGEPDRPQAVGQALHPELSLGG